MKTTFTSTEKSPNSTCINMNTYLKNKAITFSHIAESNLNYQQTEAIVIDIFRSTSVNTNGSVKFTHIIETGDEKRLNKNGVLRVYNLAEAIDIPVKSLLGKFKTSHIGTTLIMVNNRWSIAGGLTKQSFDTKEGLFFKLQKLVKYVAAM